MISKPEKIIRRIIKAVGFGQSVLVIGEWQEDLIKGIREKQNIVEMQLIASLLPDNSFTRIIADYNSPIFNDKHSFFNEARRLLLPTGVVIISANCRDGIFEKIIKLFKKQYIKEDNIKKIKPKTLQDQIHDNSFLIDGYYGYPGGHLLMMAQIINKEVTTLFTSEKQETMVN